MSCGTGSNVDNIIDPQSQLRAINSRSVAQGCGRPYWSCSSSDRTAHEKQPCSTSGCSYKYRNCLLHTKDHSNHGSGSASASPLSPSGGSYTASAGGTHTASLSLASAYSSIYWYVKSPSESGLGTSVSYVSGDGSSTSASFSWSVPSGASGDYVITAYTYLSDNSVVQPSYTVTVGSSTPFTPTDNTPDCSSCTDGCSSCPSTDTDGDADESSTASTSPYSLSASSTGSPFQPGDTVTLTLSGNESYYSVDWSLESPQYTSSTNLSYDSGDINGSYDSSVTYTFPSGYNGDYVFKAIVYTSGNMTRYEHTYTVTLGY